MSHRVSDIAAALGAEAHGATDLSVRGPAEPARATRDDLALAMSPRYAGELAAGQARAAVLWAGADWQALGLEAAILVTRPRLAMAGITRRFDSGPAEPGIHPSAVVAADAEIGPGAGIGPLTVIGAGVRIGAGARIGAQVTIAAGVTIGRDCWIRAGARIMDRSRIGDRFIAQPGAIVGSDGFSFVTATPSGAEQVKKSLGAVPVVAPEDATWHRIHSLGGVEIGDDVEVGAAATIDSGTVRPTRIGRGTKIDNLVQIAHNVVIGEDTLICAQVGIAGSTTVGDRTILAGKVGAADNISIGSDVVAGAGAVILNRVRDNSVVFGAPAIAMDQEMAIIRALRRLPRLLRDVSELKKSVQKPDAGA